jgi:hypothetical protein
MPIDDGHAIAYTALERGTPVYSSDEQLIGEVAQVLDNKRERIFDGLVLDTPDGARFVDAPEVARTAERAVTLAITAEEAAELGPPEQGAPVFRPRGGGKWSQRLRGGWRKQ